MKSIEPGILKGQSFLSPKKTDRTTSPTAAWFFIGSSDSGKNAIAQRAGIKSKFRLRTLGNNVVYKHLEFSITHRCYGEVDRDLAFGSYS